VGIEQLLKNTDLISVNQNALDYFMESIVITYFEENDVAYRFYYEDYAIGHFLPWFNIDAER
jgi:hypothetical protein